MDDTLRTVCKSLIVNGNSTRVEEQQLFYMVDKCLNFSVSSVDQNASISGSFNPVYSWKTNLIYYNRKCADCHNQREVTQFEPAIQCSALKESYTNVVYGVMIGNTLDSDCTIKFVPPSDMDMWSQICDPKKKYDCSPKSPFYTLRDRCASFNATYLTKLGAFANIYCYLCISVKTTEAEMKAILKHLCDPDVSHKFWSQHEFTVLIDQETLHSVSSEKENEEHQWCDAAHSATLRAVCFELFCLCERYHVFCMLVPIFVKAVQYLCPKILIHCKIISKIADLDIINGNYWEPPRRRQYLAEIL